MHSGASRAQALAVKALALTLTGHLEDDTSDPLVGMLASKAHKDPVLKQLLNEMMSGNPLQERLDLFERHVGECTENQQPGKVLSRSMLLHPNKDASRVTAPPQPAVTEQRPSENAAESNDVPKTEISALQTLAMRARVMLHHSGLTTSHAVINKIIANAKADSTFADVVSHVAGGTRNIEPNQERLRIFKSYIVSALAPADHKGAPEPDIFPTAPEKLSIEEWPLIISNIYATSLQQDARFGSSKGKSTFTNQSKAAVKYRNHSDYGIQMGWQDHHDVAYPLSLLPKKTWDAMHNNKSQGAVCSYCRKPSQPSAHQRKLFLVAERLSWAAGTFAIKARSKIEEALWAVNYELGIEEPVMLSSQESVFGGKQSGRNRWYPYQSQTEAQLVLWVIERAEVPGETSWDAWKSLAAEQLRQASANVEEGSDDAVFITGERPALGEMSDNQRRSPQAHSHVASSKSLSLIHI